VVTIFTFDRNQFTFAPRLQVANKVAREESAHGNRKGTFLLADLADAAFEPEGKRKLPVCDVEVAGSARGCCLKPAPSDCVPEGL
jgi:hypothetical protein